MKPDIELKKILSEMLPKKVTFKAGSGFCWTLKPTDESYISVFDNQILDICNQVELSLDWKQYAIFIRELKKMLVKTESASWQQRVMALESALFKGAFPNTRYCESCKSRTTHIEKTAFDSDGDERYYYECDYCSYVAYDPTKIRYDQ